MVAVRSSSISTSVLFGDNVNTIGLGFNIPIAYIYGPGIHCRDCTQKRFGTNRDGYIALTDNGAAMKDDEGREVRPVFLWSEYHHNSCDDCGKDIEAR